MLPISIAVWGVCFCASLASIALAVVGCEYRVLTRISRKCTRIGAAPVLVWITLLALEPRQSVAAIVNSDIVLGGTFGSLSGSGSGSITKIGGNLKTWALFGHIDTLISADPQIRNVAVTTQGIPSAAASAWANLDYDDVAPGTPAYLHSLSVDLNGSAGNNKNIGFNINNSASPWNFDIGLLGTAGLVLTYSGNITDITFISTSGVAADPGYSIPGVYTFQIDGTISARLVNVPLLGTINLGIIAPFGDTLETPGVLPGTVTLSDLQDGAPPFPNDMLVNLAAAVAVSTPLKINAPIDFNETYVVPDGKSAFSSLQIQGSLHVTLNLSLSHNLNGTVQNALIPEPGSMVLTLIGAVGVTVVALRRKLRERP